MQMILTNFVDSNNLIVYGVLIGSLSTIAVSGLLYYLDFFKDEKDNTIPNEEKDIIDNTSTNTVENNPIFLDEGIQAIQDLNDVETQTLVNTNDVETQTSLPILYETFREWMIRTGGPFRLNLRRALRLDTPSSNTQIDNITNSPPSPSSIQLPASPLSPSEIALPASPLSPTSIPLPVSAIEDHINPFVSDEQIINEVIRHLDENYSFLGLCIELFL